MLPFTYAFSLMPNARNNLWKELKNICNKNAKVQGVKYWKYILKAKDYVPLKDLKEWIKKEEVEQIKKQQEEDKAYQERVKHGGRF